MGLEGKGQQVRRNQRLLIKPLPDATRKAAQPRLRGPSPDTHRQAGKLRRRVARLGFPPRWSESGGCWQWRRGVTTPFTLTPWELLTREVSGTQPSWGLSQHPACLSPQDDQLLDDGKTLGECGFTSQTARPQAPATVGLAFRADEAFEALRIEPFSSPPELPDVMKPQDSGSSANEQAVQ
uniref:Transcription elongation factor B polypeptide 2 n=1 Tax=Ursus maritimus TaxID=29073 RepID=A0A452SYR6_URSMA